MILIPQSTAKGHIGEGEEEEEKEEGVIWLVSPRIFPSWILTCRRPNRVNSGRTEHSKFFSTTSKHKTPNHECRSHEMEREEREKKRKKERKKERKEKKLRKNCDTDLAHHTPATKALNVNHLNQKAIILSLNYPP